MIEKNEKILITIIITSVNSSMWMEMKGHVIRQRWYIFLYVGKFDWKSFIKIKNERRGWFRQFRIDSDDELFHSKFPLSYKVAISCSLP